MIPEHNTAQNVMGIDNANFSYRSFREVCFIEGKDTDVTDQKQIYGRQGIYTPPQCTDC